MKILFTNNTFSTRAGTELYSLDVARRLVARGHTPIAYSPRLGEVADELRRATVPVVDELARVHEPPDLLHLQHHLEAMTALLHFPGVPAVYVCHGWLPWEEAPPRFPRILRYVAVDTTTRDRLEHEAGIPAEQIDLQLNFVDLERFRPRDPLPERPRRALLFSNEASEATPLLRVVREACRRTGVALDVAGIACGRPVARPEEILPAYDLVFAKGRAALEALAVGAAVVPCGVGGMGPLVTAADLDRLRPLNFGVRALASRLDAGPLTREIERYDRADAARVSARIRAEAGLDGAVDRLVDLYGRVIDEHRQRPLPSPEEESRAAAAYLRGLDVHLGERARLGHEGAVLAEENEDLRRQNVTLRADLAFVQKTSTWRWRQRIVGLKPLVSAYRRLRRLPPDPVA